MPQASSYAHRLEDEKRRSEEHVNELKAMNLRVAEMCCTLICSPVVPVYSLTVSERTLFCVVLKCLEVLNPFFPSIRPGLQSRQVQLQQSQPIFQEREDLRQLRVRVSAVVAEVVTMETRAVSRVFSNSKASFAVRYRLWINGLFAWHKSHPEMSLHFLRIATQWFDSKQEKLRSAAIRMCCAVRYRGIRDLTLPLANSLLEVLHADMELQNLYLSSSSL
eukprot:s2032_g2.t1